jgi:serine/threonine protein kinase
VSVHYVDVYSLAASLYYAITGKRPTESFQRKAYNMPLVPPIEHNSSISNQLNQAILKGMELEPENRPQTMHEWLELLEEPPATIPPPPPQPPTHKPVTPQPPVSPPPTPKPANPNPSPPTNQNQQSNNQPTPIKPSRRKFIQTVGGWVLGWVSLWLREGYLQVVPRNKNQWVQLLHHQNQFLQHSQH